VKLVLKPTDKVALLIILVLVIVLLIVGKLLHPYSGLAHINSN
jgi:hypothetical protein